MVVRELFLLMVVGVCSLLFAGQSTATEGPLNRCPFAVRLLMAQGAPVRDEPFPLGIVVEGVDDAAVEMGEASGAFRWVLLEKRPETVSDLVLEHGELQRKETKRVWFEYCCTVKVSGEVPMPRFAVKSGGYRCDGPEVLITVHEPLEAPQGTFQVMLSKSLVYVYETAVLTGVLRVPEGVEVTTVHLPLLEVPGCQLHPERSSPLPDGMPFPLSLSSMRIAATKRHVPIAGEECQEIRFDVPFSMESPGRFALPKASVRYRVKGKQGWAVVEARSEALEVQVLPLPEENRPEGFELLVGSYTLQAAAHPVRALPGQAVTVTATLSGTGRLQLSDPARLWRSSEWHENFEIPRDISPPEKTEEGLRIVQTVRPRHPAVQRIPSLEVAYFDPEAGVYTRAKSPPVGFRVDLPPDIDLIVNTPGNGGLGRGARPGDPAPKDTEKNERVFAIPQSGGKPSRAFWLPIGSSPVAALGPFGVLLCLWGFRRTRERFSLHERFRRCWNAVRCRRRILALRRLSYPCPYAQALYETLKRCALCDGIRRSEATTGEEMLERICRGRNALERAVLERLFHNLDRLLYGPSFPESRPVREELESQALEAVGFLWGPGRAAGRCGGARAIREALQPGAPGRIPARDAGLSNRLHRERGGEGPKAQPRRRRDRAWEAFPAVGRWAFVVFGLCCCMALFMVFHSPWKDRPGVDPSTHSPSETAGEPFPERIVREPLRGSPSRAEEHLEALILENALRTNGLRPDASLYARLVSLYGRLGDTGRTVLWQRRAERLLGGDTAESLRCLWRDLVRGGDFRSFVGRFLAWDVGAILRAPCLRLFALSLYWLYGLVLCLRLTGRLKAFPRLLVHTVAGLSLVSLSFVAWAELMDRYLPLGVVTGSPTGGFSGPGAAFSPAVPDSLSAGTVFRVLNEVDGQLRVLTQNGDTLWIPARFTELISG